MSKLICSIVSISVIFISSYVFAEQNSKVILASEIEWQKLNPARGEKSPKAGTLWGDRMAEVPTGFLAKFVDGFSSPPHIHNATYRAVVISGNIHNDDPDAAHMWMPAGSFWTQPKGEAHITAAKGSENIALVEIDKGPYLVMHREEAFDSGERPINVDASNIIWLDLPGKSAASSNPKIAYLWGDYNSGKSYGTFLKLPAGYTANIQTIASEFHAVVIKGQLSYLAEPAKQLEPGSYFGSTSEATHQVSSATDQKTVIYIRTDAKYNVTGTPK